MRGWQKLYQQVEDELDDPRALALPNWTALMTLAEEITGAGDKLSKHLRSRSVPALRVAG